MDLIVIPQALLMLYGGVVLTCGGVLGFITARNLKRLRDTPEPPDLLERRTAILERELEAAQAELANLREESEFFRRLNSPRVPETHPREDRRSVA